MDRKECNRQIRIARLAWRNGEIGAFRYLVAKKYWTKQKKVLNAS